jgi:methylated-DNA-[protein]-cysteine S-methyltransferase
MNTKVLEYKTIDTPVGNIQLIAHADALVAILWENEDFSRIKLPTESENRSHPILLETERQLIEYFENKRQAFDVPIELIGTVFQKKVWEVLLTIPFGKTISYGAIAKQLGDPKTVRAVGGALNKNPISIIVPCHRVVGATGSLVGFAGGLSNKSILLNIENPHKQPTLWED